MHLRFFISIVLLLLLGLVAKSSGKKLSYNRTKFENFYAAWYAPIRTLPSFKLYQGFKLGAELPLIYYKKITENRKSELKFEELQTIAITNMGGYFAKNNHKAFFISEEIALRYVLNKGLLVEGSVGLGVMKGFFKEGKNPLLKLGELPKWHTNLGLLPSIGFGVGWDFKYSLNLPVLLHFKASIYNHMNSGLNAFPVTEIGLTYKFVMRR